MTRTKGGILLLPIWDLIQAFIAALPAFIVNPFFWLIVLIVGLQYRRSARMEQRLLGANKYKLGQQVLLSIMFGLLGGLVGSLVLVGVGVTLSETGIGVVWPVAIVLMAINPRFMCFAYAGGIVSFASLVTGWPKVFVPGIMSLVAILHLTESALIYFSGHLHATPIFVKGSDEKLVGAFNMQKFWPLPLMALSLAVFPSGIPEAGTIAMPNWWPLFRTAPLDANTLFLLIPVVAGLGYGDIAITMSPREKSRATAKRLMWYSLIILALAYGALHLSALAWVVAIAAPLLHEVLVVVGALEEQTGRPLYRHSGRGLMVLDTIPGQPAARMGLNTGDIILKVNDQEVNDGATWQELTSIDEPLCLQVRSSKGRLRQLRLERNIPLGLIFVPDDQVETYAEMRMDSPLLPLLRWLGVGGKQ